MAISSVRLIVIRIIVLRQDGQNDQFSSTSDLWQVCHGLLPANLIDQARRVVTSCYKLSLRTDTRAHKFPQRSQVSRSHVNFPMKVPEVASRWRKILIETFKLEVTARSSRRVLTTLACFLFFHTYLRALDSAKVPFQEFKRMNLTGKTWRVMQQLDALRTSQVRCSYCFEVRRVAARGILFKYTYQIGNLRLAKVSGSVGCRAFSGCGKIMVITYCTRPNWLLGKWEFLIKKRERETDMQPFCSSVGHGFDFVRHHFYIWECSALFFVPLKAIARGGRGPSRFFGGTKAKVQRSFQIPTCKNGGGQNQISSPRRNQEGCMSVCCLFLFFIIVQCDSRCLVSVGETLTVSKMDNQSDNHYTFHFVLISASLWYKCLPRLMNFLTNVLSVDQCALGVRAGCS